MQRKTVISINQLHFSTEICPICVSRLHCFLCLFETNEYKWWRGSWLSLGLNVSSISFKPFSWNHFVCVLYVWWRTWKLIFFLWRWMEKYQTTFTSQKVNSTSPWFVFCRLVFGHLVCNSKDINRIIVLNLQCDTWWRARRVFHRTSVAAFCIGIDTIETRIQLHRTIDGTDTRAASQNARQISIEWVVFFSAFCERPFEKLRFDFIFCLHNLDPAGESDFTIFMTDYDTFAGVFTCQKLAFAHRQSATLLSRSKDLDKLYVDKVSDTQSEMSK